MNRSNPITLALAGDTMLGRGVARELEERPDHALFSDGVIAAAREADLFVLNLECCVSERGRPWEDPRKPFFFRAPPRALDALVTLGVDCVTLANNHALDFGQEALLDTLRHLDAAGIHHVGAGADVGEARRPQVLEARGFRLRVAAVSDHPRDFAAADGRPGIAFADMWRSGVPGWLGEAAAGAGVSGGGCDAVLVTPHWGPNMTQSPVPHVRRAARALVEAGATLVAGHSAHVFQGVDGRVLYDLGDFIDDYRVDPVLRNDLGLLWLVELDGDGPRAIEAVPLALDYCHTRLADGEEADWIARRLEAACSEFDTMVDRRDGRLVVQPG